MCEAHPESELGYPSENSALTTLDITGLIPYARFLCNEEGIRRTAVGFIGYKAASAGDKVLIAVDSQYDPRIPEAIAKVLRDEKGAKVDIITVDIGPDRPFDDLDEIRVIMRREHYRLNPRRYEGFPWVEELAVQNGYKMLIHGRGGGHAADPRVKLYEFIPWQLEEQFAGKATIYPREVHALINRKSWELIWQRGRGGKVHLTDPEGTDITYTLWDDYFDRSGTPFKETPNWGHLMGHPLPPIVKQEDSTGRFAGTTNHFGRPLPRIALTMENGRLERIEGGGRYGDGWRELLEESRKSRYPCFPREGLFWLWEIAIGTNPKVRRPANIHMLSSGGSEWERRRSGVIHVGIGTSWRSEYENWAAERGLLYGHLHIHLLFPTLDVTTKTGETLRVIDKGRLTSMDDPEVRAVAEKYGNPDELLKEDWIPDIPGISAAGSYEEYAKNPVPWIYPADAI